MGKAIQYKIFSPTFALFWSICSLTPSEILKACVADNKGETCNKPFPHTNCSNPAVVDYYMAAILGEWSLNPQLFKK